MFTLSAIETFGSLGAITSTQADAHAKRIATAAKLEPVPPDKELAASIVTAVINLMLPSITDEQLVIGYLPLYGVSQKVTDLVFNALPPYEMTPVAPGQPPAKIPPSQRIVVAQKKVAGMTMPMKIALGVSAAALVGALVLTAKKRREG